MLATTLVCAYWAWSDRPFDFLDAASLMALWLAVVIQSAQVAEHDRTHTRDEALHKKLDEILRAIPEADDSLRGIEQEPTRTTSGAPNP